MTTTPTPQQVLDLPMQGNSAGASTVREYLVALLRVLWRDQDGFIGKRPFGDSDWAIEVYDSLIRAGYVAGKVDEDGYLVRVDSVAADRLMDAAILALSASPPPDGGKGHG